MFILNLFAWLQISLSTCPWAYRYFPFPLIENNNEMNTFVCSTFSFFLNISLEFISRRTTKSKYINILVFLVYLLIPSESSLC